MKNRLLHIFFLALAALLCLSSCTLEEPIDTPQNSDGYIEFVARPTRYNDVDVETKATDAEITAWENNIYTAYFMVYDNSGTRILFRDLSPENGQTTSIPNQIIQTDKALTDATVCYIANVPYSFVSELTTLTALNNATLDITYATNTTIGVPSLDLDDDSKTSSIQCIPMFGMQSNIDMSTSSSVTAITIKRLFAKVSVSLMLNLNLGFSNAIQTGSYFLINSYKIANLPQKVNIVEPTLDSYESNWVSSNSFEGELFKTQLEHKLYNTVITQSDYTTYTYDFEFYVPEYYLQPLSSDAYYNLATENPETRPANSYGKQEYKPLMYDKDIAKKRPICLTINGVYTPVSGNLVSLKYDVFLGENNSTSFTLKRNTNYLNKLTIKGTSNTIDNQLDHRVQVTPFDLADIYGQTANSYLLKDEGTYYLPAIKGVHKGSISGIDNKYKCNGVRAEVLVKDNQDLKISNVSYDKSSGQIKFDVTDIADGNAIIALYNEAGTIEWSWHLWFNDGFKIGNNRLLSVGNDTYPISTVKLMSINLGMKPDGILDQLSTGAVTGLYYQHTNKNPYFHEAYDANGNSITAKHYGGGSLYDSNGTVETPNWSTNTKAQTDPCPPGYKIPLSSTWYGANETGATIEHYNFELPLIGSIYSTFLYWDNNNNDITDNIWYPYAGYYDSSGGKTIKEDKNQTRYSTKHDDVINLGVKLKEVKFSVSQDKIYGQLLAGDKIFEYKVNTDNTIAISELKYSTFGISYIKINGGSVMEWISKNINIGELYDVLGEDVKDKTKTIFTFKNPDSNKYNIRCITDE